MVAAPLHLTRRYWRAREKERDSLRPAHLPASSIRQAWVSLLPRSPRGARGVYLSALCRSRRGARDCDAQWHRLHFARETRLLSSASTLSDTVARGIIHDPISVPLAQPRFIYRGVEVRNEIVSRFARDVSAFTSWLYANRRPSKCSPFASSLQRYFCNCKYEKDIYIYI